MNKSPPITNESSKNDNKELSAEEGDQGKGDEAPETLIKISPSDLEISESDDDDDGGHPLDPDVEIKEDVESGEEDVSSGQSEEEENLSGPGFSNGSSDEEEEKEARDGGLEKDKAKRRGRKRKESGSPEECNRSRRPKQKRGLNEQDDADDSGSEGEETKPVLKPGGGYPVEFKMKVLRYSDTHSTAATAEKFGLQQKRVREWKSLRQRIEEDSEGRLIRRPRSDGFTVEQKLKAVALATERSIDEARLRYNVDRGTIGRWKAKKSELEARLLRGEAKSIRQSGAGRKPRYTQIENSLRDWIVSQQSKDASVNHKMILAKAKALMEEDPRLKDVRGPRTWCWVTGFLKRQKLGGIVGNSLQSEDTPGKREKRENSSIQAKEDSQDDDDDSQHSEDEGNLSPSWKSSSDSETAKRVKVKKHSKKKVGSSSKRKRLATSKPKRPRGRPKMPRRLNIPEGEDDYTSEDDEGDDMKPVLKPGSGYPIEFKMRVLKYAENHSSAATAEKFGLQPVRVRDWKRAKCRISEESKGVLKRRPRSDGFTVEEKLQAVAFAEERSIDEARLLYNVDRNTIGKWKSKKAALEARLSRGEGNFIREVGSGRKPQYTQIEESLKDWIVALRLKGVTLNYKMILNKAKTLIEEDPTTRELAVPRTWSWVTGFLKRQNIHGLLGNTLGHEDPRELLNIEGNSGDMDGKKLAERILEIPENPNKRNRRTITLEDKVNIIRRIENGETQGTVAKSLNVATSTIQTIWSCRNEILHKYVNPKMKTKSDALLWKTYSSLGSALEDWLEQQVSKSLKFTGSTLMEKASQLSETYRLPQFNGEAKQWLKIFCKRHKLFDVLTELKDGNLGASTSSSSTKAQNPPNISGNPDDSKDHHDDDFHSDFHFNEFVTPKIDDAHQQQSQQPVANHHAFSTENLNNQRYSTTSGIDKNSPVISTADAIKYYGLLRNWINVNYGAHENILSSHLSGVENSVLKKQMSDTGYSNNSYS